MHGCSPPSLNLRPNVARDPDVVVYKNTITDYNKLAHHQGKLNHIVASHRKPVDLSVMKKWPQHQKSPTQTYPTRKKFHQLHQDTIQAIKTLKFIETELELNFHSVRAAHYKQNNKNNNTKPATNNNNNNNTAALESLLEFLSRNFFLRLQLPSQSSNSRRRAGFTQIAVTTVLPTVAIPEHRPAERQLSKAQLPPKNMHIFHKSGDKSYFRSPNSNAPHELGTLIHCLHVDTKKDENLTLVFRFQDLIQPGIAPPAIQKIIQHANIINPKKLDKWMQNTLEEDDEKNDDNDEMPRKSSSTPPASHLAQGSRDAFDSVTFKGDLPPLPLISENVSEPDLLLAGAHLHDKTQWPIVPPLDYDNNHNRPKSVSPDQQQFQRSPPSRRLVASSSSVLRGLRFPKSNEGLLRETLMVEDDVFERLSAAASSEKRSVRVKIVPFLNKSASTENVPEKRPNTAAYSVKPVDANMSSLRQIHSRLSTRKKEQQQQPQQFHFDDEDNNNNNGFLFEESGLSFFDIPASSRSAFLPAESSLSTRGVVFESDVLFYLSRLRVLMRILCESGEVQSAQVFELLVKGMMMVFDDEFHRYETYISQLEKAILSFEKHVQTRESLIEEVKSLKNQNEHLQKCFGEKEIKAADREKALKLEIQGIRNELLRVMPRGTSVVHVAKCVEDLSALCNELESNSDAFHGFLNALKDQAVKIAKEDRVEDLIELRSPSRTVELPNGEIVRRTYETKDKGVNVNETDLVRAKNTEKWWPWSYSDTAVMCVSRFGSMLGNGGGDSLDWKSVVADARAFFLYGSSFFGFGGGAVVGGFDWKSVGGGFESWAVHYFSRFLRQCPFEGRRVLWGIYSLYHRAFRVCGDGGSPWSSEDDLLLPVVLFCRLAGFGSVRDIYSENYVPLAMAVLSEQEGDFFPLESALGLLGKYTSGWSDKQLRTRVFYDILDAAGGGRKEGDNDDAVGSFLYWDVFVYLISLHLTVQDDGDSVPSLTSKVTGDPLSESSLKLLASINHAVHDHHAVVVAAGGCGDDDDASSSSMMVYGMFSDILGFVDVDHDSVWAGGGGGGSRGFSALVSSLHAILLDNSSQSRLVRKEKFLMCLLDGFKEYSDRKLLQFHPNLHQETPSTFDFKQARTLIENIVRERGGSVPSDVLDDAAYRLAERIFFYSSMASNSFAVERDQYNNLSSDDDPEQLNCILRLALGSEIPVLLQNVPAAADELSLRFLVMDIIMSEKKKKKRRSK